MREIRKRIINTKYKQLGLFSGSAREAVRRLIQLNGSRLLIASSVALICGLFIHPHLAVALAPICTALYAAGIVQAKRHETRGDVVVPLYGLLLGQGLEVRRRPRPVKHTQKTLDLR